MNLNYLIYCTCFLLVISACNSNDNVQVNSSMLYFKNHSNPLDTIYIGKMERTYHTFKQNKQYDSCATLLIYVGSCLYANAMSGERFNALSHDCLNHIQSSSSVPARHELSNMLACNYASEGMVDSALLWFKRGMNNLTGERMQRANGFACSETGLIYLSKSQLDSANLSVNYLQLSSMLQSLQGPY